MGRTDITCGGELDYDDGFNNLICTKCGRQYHARDLKKAEKDQLIIVGGKKTMRVKVMIGKEVISDSSKNKVAKVIDPEPLIKQEIKPEPLVKSTVIEKPKTNVSIPKAAIFNRTEEVKNNIKEDNSIIEEAITYVGIPEDIDSNTDIPNLLKGETIEMKRKSNNTDIIYDETEIYSSESDEEEYDKYEDDDEEEDYEQYLSNRERKQIRRSEKQNRRTDFGDYF